MKGANTLFVDSHLLSPHFKLHATPNRFSVDKDDLSLITEMLELYNIGKVSARVLVGNRR
jgi:hypothetical protein